MTGLIIAFTAVLLLLTVLRNTVHALMITLLMGGLGFVSVQVFDRMGMHIGAWIVSMFRF